MISLSEGRVIWKAMIIVIIVRSRDFQKRNYSMQTRAMFMESGKQWDLVQFTEFWQQSAVETTQHLGKIL